MARRLRGGQQRLFPSSSVQLRQTFDAYIAMAPFEFISNRSITDRRITLSIDRGRIQSTAKEEVTSRAFIGVRRHQWCEVGDPYAQFIVNYGRPPVGPGLAAVVSELPPVSGCFFEVLAVDFGVVMERFT